MYPVVRRQRLYEFVVHRCEPSRLLEPAEDAISGDGELVDVGDVVGVTELADELQPVLRQAQSLDVFAVCESGDRACTEGV